MTDVNAILNDLTAPADPAAAGFSLPVLNRRRFIQGALALTAAGMTVPSWLADTVGATPPGPGEGILVVVLLGGGNDGLNTIIPIDDPRYRDLRRNIAISDTAALRIGGGLALHPKLTHAKSMYDQGRLAIVTGVGNTTADLSHFTSMATWMAGGPVQGVPTGWLGRWLDTRPADHVDGVVVDSGVPLHLVGARNRASAVPADIKNVFGTNPGSPGWGVVHEAARTFANAPTGLGALADMAAATQRTAVDFGRQIKPMYETGLPGDGLARRLAVAARVINAGFGTRVIGVSLGSFDHHDGQPWQHEAKLAELDAGIKAFFATLDPRWAAQTTLATFSEFGRRARSNASAGTDHGTASVMLVAGAGVNGGVHGTQPSLANLDRHGNLAVHVDYRSVYATLLSQSLGADPAQILGANFEQLPLLGERTLSAAHGDVLRLYRAFFNREPDPSGARYWIATYDKGTSLDVIAESFAMSEEFKANYAGTSNLDYITRVYRNVLGRPGDPGGITYWKGMLDSRKLTRGGVVRWIAANDEFKNRYTYTKLP